MLGTCSSSLCTFFRGLKELPAQGEALARTFSTSHGLSCICVRLGGFPADINPGGGEIAPDAHESVSNAVSYEDAAQVFGKCVDVDDSTKFLIVAAISRHELSHQDVQHTIDSIGYEPHDGYLKPKL